MPCIRRTVTAATENAIDGLKFQVQNRPSLVTLYASSAAAGDTLSFSVDTQDVVLNAPINIESADRAIDTDRDAILVQELVPAGKFFLAINSVGGTDVSFQLNIEPVA